MMKFKTLFQHLCLRASGAAMLLMLLPDVAGAVNLPAPPVIEGAGGGSDIWEYVKAAVAAIAGVVLIGLAVAFAVYAGGGLLSSIEEARKKGEWGRFFMFLIALMISGVLIFFLVYYANENYLKLI